MEQHAPRQPKCLASHAGQLKASLAHCESSDHSARSYHGSQSPETVTAPHPDCLAVEGSTEQLRHLSGSLLKENSLLQYTAGVAKEAILELQLANERANAKLADQTELLSLCQQHAAALQAENEALRARVAHLQQAALSSPPPPVERPTTSEPSPEQEAHCVGGSPPEAAPLPQCGPSREPPALESSPNERQRGSVNTLLHRRFPSVCSLNASSIGGAGMDVRSTRLCGLKRQASVCSLNESSSGNASPAKRSAQEGRGNHPPQTQHSRPCSSST